MYDRLIWKMIGKFGNSINDKEQCFVECLIAVHKAIETVEHPNLALVLRHKIISFWSKEQTKFETVSLEETMDSGVDWPAPNTLDRWIERESVAAFSLWVENVYGKESRMRQMLQSVLDGEAPGWVARRWQCSKAEVLNFQNNGLLPLAARWLGYD